MSDTQLLSKTLLAGPARPGEEEESAVQAAESLLTSLRLLAKTGHNVVGEILQHSGTFVEWEHYPENDVYDPETRCQYYYHAHPPMERSFTEHGHFHLFAKASPERSSRRKDGAGHAGELTHLVAISMDVFGMPRRLFTTNRWVTGERWLPADRVVAMVDRFAIELVRPNLVVSHWITAMVQLFRPTIRNLIIDRDRHIEAWRREHSSVDVFEDRRLEITSLAEIDVEQRIRDVTRHLEQESER